MKQAHDRPVVLCEVLQPDGGRSVGLRVYCPRHRQSVALDTCRECPRCLAIASDAAGSATSVRCTPGTSGVADPGDVAVGALMAGAGSAAVRHDVPEGTLRALFVKHQLRVVFVVDEAHRVVGVVREMDLMHRGFSDVGLDDARGIMSTTLVIREDVPIRDALLQMANARLRHAPVVTSDGELLGTLFDIAGLRWLRNGPSTD